MTNGPGTIELQALTTVQGGAGVEIVQAREGWVDISEYSKLCVVVVITQESGSAELKLATAPVAEDEYFDVISDATRDEVGRHFFSLASTDTQPPLAFMRWEAVGSSTPWSLTFRIDLVPKYED
jgi:hypothetical protein